jgi:hypothetical protein
MPEITGLGLIAIEERRSKIVLSGACGNQTETRDFPGWSGNLQNQDNSFIVRDFARMHPAAILSRPSPVSEGLLT